MDSREPGSDAEHGPARDAVADARTRSLSQRFADQVRRWPIPFAWAMVLILLLATAFWSSRSGSGNCDEPQMAGLSSASEHPTENEAAGDAGDGSQPSGADDESGATSEPSQGDAPTPHVLKDVGDQPAVVALGRSRGERRAWVTFDPLAEDDSTRTTTATAATAIAATATATTATATTATPTPSTATPSEAATSAATPSAGAAGAPTPSAPTPSETDPSSSEPPSDPGGTARPLADLAGPEPIGVVLNPLLREDGLSLRNGRDNDVTAKVFAVSHFGAVTVELCVSRRGGAIHPGTYNGSVSIVDSRIQPISAQFEVRAAYPNIFLVGALAWLSTGAASLYTWLLRERRRSDERLRLRGFSEWLLTRAGLLAVASGTIAGYVAFAATYLANPTWGVTPSQVTAIVGAVFSAFVTAATTILVSASE